MEERRQELKNKQKDSSEDLERKNVQRNNSTSLSDFLDLEALAIWNNLKWNINLNFHIHSCVHKK